MNNLRKISLLLLLLFLVGGAFSCTGYRAKNHYEKGLAAIKKGEYKEAIIELKNAVRLDPNNMDALYQLGIAYLSTGETNQIQEGYHTLSELSSKRPDRVDVQIRLGEIFLLWNKLEEAEKKAEWVIQKDPKNAEGHLLRTRIAAKVQRFTEAKKGYQTVTTLDPKLLVAYLEWANILVSEKNFKEAVTILTKAISIDPHFRNGYTMLAGVYQAMGDPKGAEGAYQKASQVVPKHKGAYFLLANFYISQGKKDAAEKTLIAATEIDTNDADPFLVLGDFYLRLKQWEQTEKAFLSAKSADPKSGKGGKKLALFYLDQTKKKEAASEIESLPNAIKSDTETLFLQGRLALLEEKNAAAVDLFKKAIAAKPSFGEAAYFLGAALLLQKDFLQAKTAFLEAVKHLPENDIRPHLSLSALYMQSQSYDLAAAEAQQILKWDGGNIFAATVLADVALTRKNIQRAEFISQKILQLSPKNQSSLYRMGLIQRLQNKEKEATDFFEKLLAEEVNAVDALSQIVAMHLSNRNPGKAIARVIQQIEVSPKNPRFHLLLGRLYREEKQFGKAEESFNKAITADPKFIDPYLDLSLFYSKDKKTDQAISILDRAITADPQSAPAHMLKGTLYDAQGKTADAILAYEAVMKVDPRHSAAANNLAWIYAERNEKIDRAIDLASIAKEHLPNEPMISDTLGWVYYKKGLYLKAVSLLKESAEKLPKNPTILYHLGLAYAERNEPGDKKLAVQSLKKALALDPRFAGADVAKKKLESL
jgi:tetratricopeptide (TPR) repeat protein